MIERWQAGLTLAGALHAADSSLRFVVTRQRPPSYVSGSARGACIPPHFAAVTARYRQRAVFLFTASSQSGCSLASRAAAAGRSPAPPSSPPASPAMAAAAWWRRVRARGTCRGRRGGLCGGWDHARSCSWSRWSTSCTQSGQIRTREVVKSTLFGRGRTRRER